MARICEPCRFHTSDDSVTACESCGGPVKFTFLPPVGGEPTPLAGERAAQVREHYESQKAGFGDFFQGKMLYITGGILALVLLAGVGLFFLKGDSFESKIARIKPGMRVEDAMRIMGDNNRPKKKPDYSITIGGKPGQDDPDRFHFDDPVDVSGDGYLEYEQMTEGVRIEYSNGIVTQVIPKRAEGGMRKRITQN